jgi:hypothetical protein
MQNPPLHGLSAAVRTPRTVASFWDGLMKRESRPYRMGFFAIPINRATSSIVASEGVVDSDLCCLRWFDETGRAACLSSIAVTS